MLLLARKGGALSTMAGAAGTVGGDSDENLALIAN